ncbi:MAG: co-chaperone GroES [Planctomycetia bacterium]|nr:co-chaperone GroES [Planctomycetia bacterium]
MKKKQSLNLKEFNFLYDYILVKAITCNEIDTNNKTIGLVKPEQYEDKSEFGKVVSVGSGRLLENGKVVSTGIKKNDIVFFGKFSSEKFRYSGEDYLIIRAEDVIAVANK